MQYGARQLGCTKVQVHSYPDEPSHGARCSSAPVVTRQLALRARLGVALPELLPRDEDGNGIMVQGATDPKVN